MNHLRLGSLTILGKINLAAQLPLVFTLLLVWAAAFYLIDAWIVGETQKKVRQDLRAAGVVLHHEVDRIEDVVRFAANTLTVSSAMIEGDPEAAAEELKSILRRENLDILTLTDPRGKVLLRGANLKENAGQLAPAPLAERIRAGDAFRGPMILSGGELRMEGAELVLRARTPLRAPVPPEREPMEMRGLLLMVSSPVMGPAGSVVGHLYGGVLVNGNFDLIDRIKEIVYGDETYGGTEVGSATIFLDDLRVATTIRLKDGGRAVGTRVSSEVADVLRDGRSWIARAWVVEDWYLTAYEPILGPDAEAIGALYVGQLERPFSDLKSQAALILLVLLLMGGSLGTLISRTAAKRISRPIRVLEESALRVAAGERDVFVPATTRDEIGVLTSAFNRMTAALREQEETLQELNRDLENKVRERTAELEEKSGQLIRAREELARSEKLAAIGSLAAGVAHEINNPAAIIRGNVEILLAMLPPEHPCREEGLEILKQTERISLITQGMLTFARRQTFHSDPVHINELLKEVLTQVVHQAPAGHITVRKDFAASLPAIEADGESLRQVFNNLILNALQAMEQEGHLSVITCRQGDSVVVEVGDTGPGIATDVREKIFDPFFTTKSKGTGLGLSVTYGIVKALGGSIEVENAEGGGAAFRVTLPVGRTKEKV